MKKRLQLLASMTKKLKIQLLLTYFIVFTIFFIAVSVLVSGSVRTMLINQIGSNRVALLRQISERANMIKTSTITLSNLYSHEVLSSGLLSNNEMSQTQQKDAIAQLSAQKQVYDEVFRHIGLGFDVLFLQKNGFCYQSPGIGTDAKTWIYQNWFRQLRDVLSESKEGTVHFSRTFSCQSGDKTIYRFAAARMIGTQDYQGMLLIIMDEQLLENLYDSVTDDGGEIYLYDQSGYIVSHSDKKMLGKQFIDVDYMMQTYGVNQSSLIKKQGKSYMLSTYLDEETGWTIVEESPTQAILGALNQTIWMIGALLLLGLALALVVSIYISWRVSTPLIELSKAMDQFGQKTFVPPSIKSGTQEIDHLQESFTHMASELSRLMDIVLEREQQKRKLEVNFLRAQINPHFLYNTLFSIRCAMEVGKSEKASQMLSAFIDLLRSTLSKKEELITLADEMETTRKYLVVQKLRYGDKINYEIELQEGTENCMIPPLILQPLVENAIFHGLEAKDEAGTIAIESSLLKKTLVITIADDGAGMSIETLQQVKAKLNRSDDQKEHSIGLSNIHRRICLNYGENYGLSIESSLGIGTTVKLRLPAEWRREEYHESTDCR